MIVLGIETATDVCSAAVLRDGAVLAEASIHVPRSHATRLAPLVEQLLAHARLTPADLDLIAVSAGPGSYTGLRIGASLARGLSLATGAALVGVGTLDALAADAAHRRPSGWVVLAVLPSRRGEVYVLATRDEERLVSPQAVALADLPMLVLESIPRDNSVAVVGAGAQSAVGAVDDAYRSVIVLDVSPSAVRVARLGAALHESGGGAPPLPFEPSYLGSFATTPPRA